MGPGLGEVDRLVPWDSPGLAPLWTDGAATAGPGGHQLPAFDAGVAYTRSPHLLVRLSERIPRLRSLDPVPPPGAGHAASWYASAVASWGHAVDPVPPLRPGKDESQCALRLAAGLPSGFIAIHPGSGSPRKNWPSSRFAELLRRLAPGEPWLLIEGPADADAAAPLRRLGGAVVHRDLPPRILAALLGRAGVYVGNDSGISHLAAAVGIPTIALFGPTDPEVWSPVGPQVTAIRSQDGTMDGIPVEPVQDAVARWRSAAGDPALTRMRLIRR